MCAHLQTNNKNSFYKVYEWKKEAVRKICKSMQYAIGAKKILLIEVSNLQECKMACMNKGWHYCVGITYSESHPTKCYICREEVFEISTIDNYFYRRVPLAGNIQ